jgi:hypothetical protein
MKIKYQESIVAFIDVLGFSNLVYDKNNSKIEHYFEYVVSDFKEMLPNKSFKYILISDSIVISCLKTNDNLSEIVFFIGKLQYKLLLKGILLRGGISFGDLYINKVHNIIVGPGLINAFALEKEAKLPKVVIDRRFILEFKCSTKSFLDNINQHFHNLYGDENEKLKLDEGGLLYINYARQFARSGPTFKKDNLLLLINLFKTHYYSHLYFEKYNWLLKEILGELDLSITHYEKHPEISISKSRLKHLNEFQTELMQL